MKVKLKELRNSQAALLALSRLPLKMKLAYKIGRVLVDAQRELELFQKLHEALILKHGGKEDPETRLPVVPDDRVEGFQPEFDELVNQEVEIWGNPINLAEFLEAESIICSDCNRIIRKGEPDIPPGVMMSLHWLIQEAETAQTKQATA